MNETEIYALFFKKTALKESSLIKLNPFVFANVIQVGLCEICT